MLRLVIAAEVALLLAVGGTLAAQRVVERDFVNGEIVRVDPVVHKVVIRTRVGDKVEEREFEVERTARILGHDEKVLVEGLRAPVFRPGARVMFRVGPRGRVITDFRHVRVVK
jgi:hypothetical protein